MAGCHPRLRGGRLFWIEFLRKLKRRGLSGVKLVISDAHAGKSGRRVVAAFIATAFAQEDAASARTQWRQVSGQVRPKLPKLGTLMVEAEEVIPSSACLPWPPDNSGQTSRRTR